MADNKASPRGSRGNKTPTGQSLRERQEFDWSSVEK